MLMKILDYFPGLSQSSASLSPFLQEIKSGRRTCLLANDYRGTCESFGSPSRHTTILSREPPGTIRAGCTSVREPNAGPDDDEGRRRGKAPKEVTTDLLRSGSLHRVSCGREWHPQNFRRAFRARDRLSRDRIDLPPHRWARYRAAALGSACNQADNVPHPGSWLVRASGEAPGRRKARTERGKGDARADERRCVPRRKRDR